MELTQLNTGLKKTVQDFAALLRLRLAENLKAVLLYGSAACGEYSKKYSDINILLIVERLDIAALKSIGILKRRRGFGAIAPLVLTKKDLETSTDTFPIEFLDIKENHILVWGEDYSKDFAIDLKNLRYQCEWELKSKLIQARQAYSAACGDKRALESFLVKNLPAFIAVFKNILRLKGISESAQDKILERIAVDFSLPADIFRQLWQLRRETVKRVEAEDIFERFLEALRQLSDKVDTLLVSG